MPEKVTNVLRIAVSATPEYLESDDGDVPHDDTWQALWIDIGRAVRNNIYGLGRAIDSKDIQINILEWEGENLVD